MRRIREYIEEAVARRSAGKYIEPTSEYIIWWLDKNGFERVNAPRTKDEETELLTTTTDRRIYFLREWGGRVKSGVGNLTMHTPSEYSLTFNFDNSGNVITIVHGRSRHVRLGVTFDEAAKIMDRMIE